MLKICIIQFVITAIIYFMGVYIGRKSILMDRGQDNDKR